MRPPSSEALSYLRCLLAIPLHLSKNLPCALRTTLRPQHHPQSAVLRQFPQCRALHLYKTARSKTVLGQHKILTFEIYKPPEPSKSDHKINLWTEAGGTRIAEGLTLEEVLENHISPGNMLYLTQQVKKSHSENWEYMKDNNIPQEFNNYAIVKAGEIKTKIAKHKHEKHPNPIFRSLAGLKEIHFNLASPAPFVMMVLSKAYAFIDHGHQVEFSIRFKGSFTSKEQRRKAGNHEIWPWMHQHFPHLRPDFILKSMPNGAYFMIHPFSDGKHVQFVISMPAAPDSLSNHGHRNFTKRALLVKKMVQTSIDEGRQAQLPVITRRKLIEQGSDMYSLDSGVSKAVVEERSKNSSFVSPKTIDVRWGSESLERLPKAVRMARMKEATSAREELERAEKQNRWEEKCRRNSQRRNNLSMQDAQTSAGQNVELLKSSEPSWTMDGGHTSNREPQTPFYYAQPSSPNSGRVEGTDRWLHRGKQDKDQRPGRIRLEGRMRRDFKDEEGLSVKDERRRAGDTIRLD